MDEDKEITLTNFISKFLLQTTTNKMTFSDYPKNISDLEINVSFGQGIPAKVPWISFTASGMSTREGYYPVLLLYKEENILVLAYGVSEEIGYETTWPEEIVKNKKRIDEELDNPYRYGTSFIHTVYDVNIENENISIKKNNKTIDEFEIHEDLKNIIDYYKKNLDYKKEVPEVEDIDLQDTVAYKLQGVFQSYGSTPLPILSTVEKIKSGEIQIPEMQREYVWETSKVRDLFDSLYKGYPIGEILLWDVTDKPDINRSIGTSDKTYDAKQYVIDGQQRLTSLYAVAKGETVFNKDYKEIEIKIDFNPFTETFETSTPASVNSSEWFHDITGLFDIVNQGKLIDAFIDNYRNRFGDENLDEDKKEYIKAALRRVAGIMNVNLQLITLSSSMDLETAADVFIRINSKAAILNQADFILTLLSVRWAEGQRELKAFSRETKTPPEDIKKPTAYNRLIEIDPSMLIYPISMVAFDRAKLINVYPLLAGDKGEENLNIWKETQNKILNRETWQSYINIILSAGFVHEKLINQPNAFIFIYGMYQIGLKHKVNQVELERVIASYFFMSTVTKRYSGSSETQIQQDIQLIRDNLEKNISFTDTLEEIMKISLTKDFWAINLTNALDSSGAAGNYAFSAYTASQVLLGAKSLYTDMRISDLLDKERSGILELLEYHHLYPASYLKNNGYTRIQEYNARANFQLISSKYNREISDESPKEYHKRYISAVSKTKIKEMLHLNALWEGWEEEDYNSFLQKRREHIAKIIKNGWVAVSGGNIKEAKIVLEEKKHTIRPQDFSTEELLDNNKVETKNLELKETYIFDVQLSENEILRNNTNDEGVKSRQIEISHMPIKTIAGFLNAEGGTLFIGVSDYFEVKGLDRDLSELTNNTLDAFQTKLITHIENDIPEIDMQHIDITYPSIDGKTIARIDVESSPEPIFVNKDGESIFYAREIGKTVVYEANKLSSYIISNFK